MIKLEPADFRQVIAIRVKEQIVEKSSGVLDRRRISRTHAPVDFYNRILRRLNPILQQSIAQVGTHARIVDKKNLNLGNLTVSNPIQLFLRNLGVALDQD